MPIISISLDDKMFKEIDIVERDMGFAGRSELVRAGIRMLIADKKARDELKGRISCVLVVTHDEGLEDPVTEIKHHFDSVVKSHLHYKLGEKKCLELMVLDGNAPEIKEIARQFQTSGSMDNVKLILP